MKKLILNVFTIALVFLCSCSTDDIIEKNNSVEKGLTADEIAFPDKLKETLVINGVSIQKTEDDIYIYQGDIILSEEQIEDIKNGGEDTSTRGAILKDSKYKWKDGKVWYCIDDKVSDRTRAKINEAIKHWESRTPLKFPTASPTSIRNYTDSYILFIENSGEGSWSSLGRIGGRQHISLDSSPSMIFTTGTVIHEIGHAIGLIHEHTRADRDKYITVNYKNLKKSAKANYDINRTSHIISGSPIITIGEIPFDFESIMLYSPYNSYFAVNSNLPTMTKKNGSLWIPQSNYLSSADVAVVRWLYPELPWFWNTNIIH